jgi:hypothetical protein
MQFKDAVEEIMYEKLNRLEKYAFDILSLLVITVLILMEFSIGFCAVMGIATCMVVSCLHPYCS